MTEPQNDHRASRIDFPELLSRVDNDRELLCELLGIFKEDFPRHLRALQDAVAHQDMKQAATLSHTLKGMLLNLSVTRAASEAAQVEQSAQQGSLAAVQTALTAFELEVQGLMAEMETHMVEVRH